MVGKSSWRMWLDSITLWKNLSVNAFLRECTDSRQGLRHSLPQMRRWNLRWRRSTRAASVLDNPTNTGQQYSKTERMKVLYTIRRSLFEIHGLRTRIAYIRFEADWIILSMWSDQFHRELKRTPSKSRELTQGMSGRFKLRWSGKFRFGIKRALHLEALIVKSIWSDHSIRFWCSAIMWSLVFELRIGKHKVVSSSYLNTFQFLGRTLKVASNSANR